MRQIKFRGKRADNGEWVFGDLLRIGGGCLIYFGSKTETQEPNIPNSSPVAVALFNDEIAVVFPDTVGKFTCLTDCNGKEIYEGDIINGCFKYDKLSADGGVIPDNDCLCKGVVKFSKDRLQWVLDIFWAESYISKWMKEEDDSEIPLVHFEYESPEFNMNLLEVIGNISDTSELLKTKLNS